MAWFTKWLKLLKLVTLFLHSEILENVFQKTE